MLSLISLQVGGGLPYGDSRPPTRWRTTSMINEPTECWFAIRWMSSTPAVLPLGPDQQHIRMKMRSSEGVPGLTGLTNDLMLGECSTGSPGPGARR